MIRGAWGSEVSVTISRYGHPERISLKRESAIPAPGTVTHPSRTPRGLFPQLSRPTLPAEDRAVPRPNSVLGPPETELKSADNDKDHCDGAFYDCALSRFSPLKQANPRASHDLDLERVRHMVTASDVLVTSPQKKGKERTPNDSLEDMLKERAPEPGVRTHERPSTLPSTLPTRKELLSLLNRQLKREQVQHKAVVRELETCVSHLETSLRASRASGLKAEQELEAQGDHMQQAVLTYEARIAALEQELCQLREERKFGAEVHRQALNDGTMKAIELDSSQKSAYSRSLLPLK